MNCVKLSYVRYAANIPGFNELVSMGRQTFFIFLFFLFLFYLHLSPARRSLMSDLGGHEGRYAFSLCVDFFNPYMNKLAGKKTSIGRVISLVCLNLPPSLRYK